MDNIIGQALAASMIVKLLVDMAKMAVKPIPRWLPVVLAIGLGMLTTILLKIADNVVLDSPVIAQCVLAGVLAAGTAVGITELHNKARGS